MKYINKNLIFPLAILLLFIVVATSKPSKAQAQVTPPPATNIALFALHGLYISLPPAQLYTPDTLKITNKSTGSTVASFTGLAASLKSNPCVANATSTYVKCTAGGTNNGMTLQVDKSYTNTGGVLDEYSLQVSGFTDGQGNQIAANINPVIKSLVGLSEAASAAAEYNFDLTFSTPTFSDAEQILQYINTNSTTLANVSTEAKITDTCSTHPGSTNLYSEDQLYPYLCMGINIRFVPSITTGLFQIKLPPIEEAVLANPSDIGNIVLNGNTAAGNTQSGFSIKSGAIALGGKVELSTTSGTSVPNYLSSSPLSWSSVSSQLQTEYNQAVSSGVTPSPVDNSTSWYLNSENSNLENSASTTFSSPPEGKLWYVPGNLTLSNSMNFNGLGTIVVGGNVTFNGTVSCSSGSEVGVIAQGSITFNGTGGVDCGSYLALGGNVTFPQSQSISQDQTWDGIFIASQNVVLPTTKYNVNINYDGNIAANPPILFRSILNTIAGASS